MDGLRIVLIIALVLLSVGMTIGVLYSMLVDIYFSAKLKYMSRVIGGLGQVLTDAAKQMGGIEKD